MIDIEKIKNDFPFFKLGYIYLDNSATTQKPITAIDAEKEYYLKKCGNPASIGHFFSNESVKILEDAREKISEFIGVKKEGIAFTKNATEALNTLVFSLEDYISENDEIISTVVEHQSNLLPYIAVAEKKKAKVKLVDINEDNTICIDDFEKLITKKTKLIGFTMCSNVSGEDVDIKEVLGIIKKRCLELNIEIPKIIIDSAQAINHKKVNFNDICEEIGIEIYGTAFSGHKMYSASGIGVMYLNPKYISLAKPRIYGSGSIIDFNINKINAPNTIKKFESGTLNVGGVVSLIKGIEYLESIGLSNIEEYILKLTKKAHNILEDIPKIYFISGEKSSSVISFYIDNINMLELNEYLNTKKIAVRTGNFSAMCFMQKIKRENVTRISLGIYNTTKDILEVKKEIINFLEK